ncbi:hypothetical protein BDZ45DRAFT_394472 [Acephala macrosclerotiorum]|nr:hypothetical protein BDZ45DRAFT_394472 [Acephala macrosclerotiorum]
MAVGFVANHVRRQMSLEVQELQGSIAAGMRAEESFMGLKNIWDCHLPLEFERFCESLSNHRPPLYSHRLSDDSLTSFTLRPRPPRRPRRPRSCRANASTRNFPRSASHRTLNWGLRAMLGSGKFFFLHLADSSGSTFPSHYPTCPWSQSKQTSPSHNTSPNQPLAGILGATATRDQHTPIWSPNLSPSNHGSQQQSVSTAYDGCNNGWNPDVSIAPPAWDLASQGFAQSLSPVSSVDYPPVHSNAITNGQPDPTLQLPDFGVYNDFGVVPNCFANFNSFT